LFLVFILFQLHFSLIALNRIFHVNLPYVTKSNKRAVKVKASKGSGKALPEQGPDTALGHQQRFEQLLDDAVLRVKSGVCGARRNG
jgi:hypothetical protein